MPVDFQLPPRNTPALSREILPGGKINGRIVCVYDEIVNAIDGLLWLADRRRLIISTRGLESRITMVSGCDDDEGGDDRYADVDDGDRRISRL